MIQLFQYYSNIFYNFLFILQEIKRNYYFLVNDLKFKTNSIQIIAKIKMNSNKNYSKQTKKKE